MISERFAQIYTYGESRACFPNVEEENQGHYYVCQGVLPLDNKHDHHGGQCLHKGNTVSAIRNNTTHFIIKRISLIS